MSLRSQQNGRRLGGNAAPSISRATTGNGGERRAPAQVGSSSNHSPGIASAPPLIPLPLAPVRFDRSGHMSTTAPSPPLDARLADSATHERTAAIYYMDGPCTVAEVAEGAGGSGRGGASSLWSSAPTPRPRRPYYVMPTAETASASFPSEEAYAVVERRGPRQPLPAFASSSPASMRGSPVLPSVEPVQLATPLPASHHATAHESSGGAATLPAVARVSTPLSASRSPLAGSVPLMRARPTPPAPPTPPAHATASPTLMASAPALMLHGVAARPSPPPPPPPATRAQAQPRRATTPPLSATRPPTSHATAHNSTRPSFVATSAAEERYATAPSASGVPTLMLVTSLSAAPVPGRPRTARRPLRAAPVAAAAGIVERSRASSVSASRRRPGGADGVVESTRAGPRKAARPTDDGPVHGARVETKPRADGEPDPDGGGEHAQAVKKPKHEDSSPSSVRPSGGSTPATSALPGSTARPSTERASRPDSAARAEPYTHSGVQSTLTSTDVTPTDARHDSFRSSIASRSSPRQPTSLSPGPVPHTPEKGAEERTWQHYPAQTASGPTGMPTPEARGPRPGSGSGSLGPTRRAATPPTVTVASTTTTTTTTAARAAPSKPAPASPHRDRHAAPRSVTPRTAAGRTHGGPSSGNGRAHTATAAAHTNGNANGSGSASTRAGPRTAQPSAAAAAPAASTSVTKTDSSKWAHLKERRRRELYAWNEFLRNQKEVVVGDAV